MGSCALCKCISTCWNNGKEGVESSPDSKPLLRKCPKLDSFVKSNAHNAVTTRNPCRPSRSPANEMLGRRTRYPAIMTVGMTPLDRFLVREQTALRTVRDLNISYVLGSFAKFLIGCSSLLSCDSEEEKTFRDQLDLLYRVTDVTLRSRGLTDGEFGCIFEMTVQMVDFLQDEHEQRVVTLLFSIWTSRLQLNKSKHERCYVHQP
jgi:hypothetical protein